MTKITINALFKWGPFTLLLFAHWMASAQPTKMAFEKFGVAEGLPEEYVTDMIQDDKGFIWCGTQNGLVKYDGYKFKVYKGNLGQKDENSLRFSSMNGGLLKGKDGKIWMGAYSNDNALVASFDPSTEVFRTYSVAGKGKKNTGLTICYMRMEDSKGNIWLYKVSESKLIRLTPGTGAFKEYNVEVAPWERKGWLTEANNRFWLLDKKGNFKKLNQKKDVFEVFQSPEMERILHSRSDTLQILSYGSKDRILLSSRYSLLVFDAKTDKVVDRFVNLAQMEGGKSIDTVLAANEDEKGQIWITHYHALITRIDPRTRKISHFRFGSGELDFGKQDSEKYRFRIELINKEGIWFSGLSPTNEKVQLFYSNKTNLFSFYDDRFNLSYNPFQTKRWMQFFSDRTGLLWLYTRPNFYKYAPKKHQMDLYRHELRKANSLPSDTTTCIFEDSKKRIWVGTINGLARYEPGMDGFITFRHNPSNNQSISDNKITFISEDAYGNIWIGTQNGLNQWQETSSFKRFFYDVKKPNDCISFCFDINKHLWLSIWGIGVLVIEPKTNAVITKYSPDSKNLASLSSTSISTIYQDSKGTMWLGEERDNEFGLFRLKENGEFIHYMPVPGNKNSLSSNEIRFVKEDARKNLWVGTDDGLNMYKYETNTFDRIKGLTTMSISTIVEDKKGKVWFGTYAGQGLLQVDPKKGITKSVGDEKGLLHNDIATDIVQDDFGKLWIPTQRGLSVFDPVTESFSNYFEKDGFQPYDKSYSIHKASNGDIWIGSHGSGLNHIVPGSLLKKDTSLPSVVITNLTINDSAYSKPDGKILEKSIAYSNEIQLEYWQKDLAFDFVALHYLRSEDNLYSWKLENYDKDWSKPSQSRNVSYTNLSPGTYIFKVKASNADGVWNETPTIITITILSPWWNTWWAYLGYFFGLGGVVIGYAFVRAESLRKENKLLEDKVVLRTQELESKTFDLENSIQDLKATQSQLIQSEKMASLGELTAGIAHEIQNPLNFVNNFSEVSNELLVEMKEELEKGNLEDVKAISDDVQHNLEKILHHGKRADAIVKGMLQHSRSSSGKKEPADINVLADEYLRLAYHGLRAKDKSFNSKMETDFDQTIGKINVIPQDIGRVILNLITNAFYVVDEKKKSGLANYDPMVSVSTKKLGEKIEISVKDNGNGIPEKVLDKIFQPFFTTKPTGQGTGLGLSLSYDIVKAHGGDLKVETKEGEGSEFVIQLPIV